MNSKKTAFLREYFKKEPSVALAFLFGSSVKGIENKESDIDIAVYFKQSQESARDKIWLDLSRVLEKEIDLICLSEAPASLVSSIFKTGKPLAVKDKKLYWELYLQKSLEAEDFLEFVNDFYRIYERTKNYENRS